MFGQAVSRDTDWTPNLLEHSLNIGVIVQLILSIRSVGTVSVLFLKKSLEHRKTSSYLTATTKEADALRSSFEEQGRSLEIEQTKVGSIEINS